MWKGCGQIDLLFAKKVDGGLTLNQEIDFNQTQLRSLGQGNVFERAATLTGSYCVPPHCQSTRSDIFKSCWTRLATFSWLNDVDDVVRLVREQTSHCIRDLNALRAEDFGVGSRWNREFNHQIMMEKWEMSGYLGFTTGF